MASELADRRMARRLPIELPVELGGDTGRTRDMSASGVYFETRQAFVPGAPITFALILEDAAIFFGEGAAPSPFRLECEGQIVRVDQREDTVGVAAALKTCRLIPYPGEAPPPLARRRGFV